MNSKGAVPDAWDDDWEAQADKGETGAPPPQTAKVSKAERRAQHAEQQKMLWDSAENPNRSYFLETQGVNPLKQEFKAPVQLLSRKPQGRTLAKRGDATNGVAGLSLEDDDEDSEEEARKKKEADFEERQRLAKLAREEKQQKYAEARARIMGTPNHGTPPNKSRDSSQGRIDRRRGPRGTNSGQGSQPTSAGQSPSRNVSSNTTQLFDQEDMGRRLPRRETPVTAQEDQPLRQPKGPEKSGRGGFGFVSQGSVAGA